MAAEERSNLCTVGGQSFTARTNVLTTSGTLVAISKLKVGDKVLATNTKTGMTQVGTVGAVLVHHDTDKYNLRVRAGSGTTVIQTTSDHLFRDATSHRWIKAAALKYGTHLRTPSGGSGTVLGGWTPRGASGWMWDLTIPGDHDFYIQAAGMSLLVHNVDPCGPRSFGGVQGQHTAEVTVTRSGQVVDSGTLVSGNMTPEEAQLGFPRSTLATHTEFRAVNQFPMEPGDVMDIKGEYPPCPSSNGAMNRAARSQGASINYSWPGGTWRAAE